MDGKSENNLKYVSGERIPETMQKPYDKKKNSRNNY